MTPCLGCVSCLLCIDERVHETCLVCCSAPSHTSAFPAALQPSPIITDARSGSLIYILCHIWTRRTFYLVPCVLSLVCLLSAEHSVLSPKHTYTHTDTAVWWRRPGLWAVDQFIYLPASSMSVCKIIGEQRVNCSLHEKVCQVQTYFFQWNANFSKMTITDTNFERKFVGWNNGRMKWELQMNRLLRYLLNEVLLKSWCAAVQCKHLLLSACSPMSWPMLWRSVTSCSPAFSPWRCCWRCWSMGPLATLRIPITSLMASLWSSGKFKCHS